MESEDLAMAVEWVRLLKSRRFLQGCRSVADPRIWLKGAKFKYEDQLSFSNTNVEKIIQVFHTCIRSGLIWILCDWPYDTCAAIIGNLGTIITMANQIFLIMGHLVIPLILTPQCLSQLFYISINPLSRGVRFSYPSIHQRATYIIVRRTKPTANKPTRGSSALNFAKVIVNTSLVYDVFGSPRPNNHAKAPAIHLTISNIVKMLPGEMNVDDQKISRPGLMSELKDFKIRRIMDPFTFYWLGEAG
ncbi:hypothetical protein LguiB_033025 [Lonicera macranthoides]